MKSVKTVTPVLAVVDVHKSYQRGPETVHALVGVDLALVPGELVALVGPSGSGKTTLLNVLAGWETPDRGSVRWRDEEADALPESARVWSELAILPQTLGLLDELDVRENVGLPLTLGRDENPEALQRIEDLLASLALADLAGRLVTDISLGERQRAALARAMVAQPAVLLADEPTSHQDADRIADVLREFRAACQRGSACLVATHNPELLDAVDRAVHLHDGHLAD